MVNRKILLAVGLLACLCTVIAIGLRHASTHRRIAAASVNAVIDAHSMHISKLLSTMHDAPADHMADAIYDELQRTPSTSLLGRGDVTVEEMPGSSERRCVITSPQILSGRRLIAPTDLRSSAP